MFASLKAWINVPYQIKPFIKRNGAGTKQYGELIDSKCYPVGDVKLVTDSEGAEVTSMTQLYVPGTEPIKVTDAVILNDEEHSIIRITSFFRNGTEDIKVVYL
jgi:hypothetical protein